MKLYDYQIHYLTYQLKFHTYMNNFVQLFKYQKSIFILFCYFIDLVILASYLYFFELFSMEMVHPIYQMAFNNREISLSYQK